MHVATCTRGNRTVDIDVIVICVLCMCCVPIAADVQSWVASLTEAIGNSLGVAQHPTADISGGSGGKGEEGTDTTTAVDSPMVPRADRRK